jgi:large subunit ribosomal protein L4
MKLDIKSKTGADVGELEVRDDVFCVPANTELVHQVFVSQLANKRQGTAKTKNRSEVSGGGAKPRPQKGSGSSRQGSIRSPLWIGGGRAFGPSPRSYRKKIPKNMRRLAILSLISDKVRSGDFILIDGIDDLGGRTKAAIGLLGGLQVNGSVLIVTDEAKAQAMKAFHNVQKAQMTHAQVLNALDLINKNKLIMTVDAVKRVEDLWGGVYRGVAQSQSTGVDVEGVIEDASSDRSEPSLAKPKNMSLEELELSSRTLKCLAGVGLIKVGDVLGKSKSDLLEIRNFGEKSYGELQQKLGEHGFLPEYEQSGNDQEPNDADVGGDK